MTMNMTIREAADQVGQLEVEREKIAERIRELRNSDNSISRGARERELAATIMAGGDISTIEAPLTSLQIRHSVQILESHQADCASRLGQAHGALRSAKVNRIRELLQAARDDYDKSASELVERWARVTALTQELAGFVTVNESGLTWNQLRIPRANIKHGNFHMAVLHPLAEEIMLSELGRRVTFETQGQLKEEGITS